MLMILTPQEFCTPCTVRTSRPNVVHRCTHVRVAAVAGIIS